MLPQKENIIFYRTKLKNKMKKKMEALINSSAFHIVTYVGDCQKLLGLTFKNQFLERFII